MIDIQAQPSETGQIADYWRLYGMNRDPFADEALENGYFTGADRQELLQSALHMARFATQVVVFSGTHGVGKTKLLEAVAASLAGVNFVLRLHADFMLTSGQLFGQIASALGFDSAGLATDELRSRVLQRLKQGVTHSKSLIILVDDAHELLQHTLASLLELTEDASNDIKLLLFAATDANGQLRPELAQPDIQQIVIEPLDPTGVEDYMRYRLTLAGFDRKFPFTRNDLLALFKHSAGVPARMHGLAEQKLRDGLLEPTQVQPASGAAWNIPWLHLTVATVLLIFISLLWTSGDEKVEPNRTTVHVPVMHTPEQRVPPDRTVAKRDEPPGSRPLIATNSRERASDQLLAKKSTAGNSAQQSTPVREKSPANPAPAVAAKVDNSRTEPTDNDALASKAVKPAQVATATPPAAKPVESKPGAASEAPPPVQRQASSSASAQPGTRTSLAGLTSDERHLMSLPASHYTLQLLGSSSRQSVGEFANSRSDIKILIFEQRLGNKRWYAAVTGDFLNREQATTALAKLPEDLRNLKPWVRSFSQVKKDIESARN